VAVESVGSRQAPLQGDELPRGVALKGDEEETGVDLARARFGRFAVGVAAAQDALAVVVLGVGEPDVRVGRDREFAVGTGGIEVDGVVFALLAERGAA